MAEGTQPNDGESPVIVSLSDAAMHMYSTAIQSLPDPSDPDFPGQAANGIGLRTDLIEAIEVEETPTEDEAARIKELIAALGG